MGFVLLFLRLHNRQNCSGFQFTFFNFFLVCVQQLPSNQSRRKVRPSSIFVLWHIWSKLDRFSRKWQILWGSIKLKLVGNSAQFAGNITLCPRSVYSRETGFLYFGDPYEIEENFTSGLQFFNFYK